MSSLGGAVVPYALALEFHRKVMINAIVRHETGKQLIASIRFVGEYYRLRNQALTTPQAMAMAKHLLFMNQYCFKNEAAIKAHQLLEAYNSHSPLLGQHRRYFLNLAVMVSTRHPQLLRKAKEQWPAPVVKSLFYGPYNLPAQAIDAALAAELLNRPAGG